MLANSQIHAEYTSSNYGSVYACILHGQGNLT